jgi:zinc finger RNA-binding protein
MKLHRKLGKTIPSAEPQILNNTPISTNDDQQISLSHLLENSIQPIGEEYIETTYDNMNKPILYHCKLCECKFNDIKGKDMHLKGKRHRLSYKVNSQKIHEN